MPCIHPESPHFLGYGAMGAVHAHLLRKEFPDLPIFYLLRSGRTPPTLSYAIHQRHGQLTRLNVINDSNGKQPIKLLIVATKAHQAEAALIPYLDRLTSKTLLVFLQNGMGLVDSLKNILPSDRIALGTTTHAAYVSESNVVSWVHEGETQWGAIPKCRGHR